MANQIMELFLTRLYTTNKKVIKQNLLMMFFFMNIPFYVALILKPWSNKVMIGSMMLIPWIVILFLVWKVWLYFKNNPDSNYLDQNGKPSFHKLIPGLYFTAFMISLAPSSITNILKEIAHHNQLVIVGAVILLFFAVLKRGEVTLELPQNKSVGTVSDEKAANYFIGIYVLIMLGIAVLLYFKS
jgi:hypothetical protein